MTAPNDNWQVARDEAAMVKVRSRAAVKETNKISQVVQSAPGLPSFKDKDKDRHKDKDRGKDEDIDKDKFHK